MVYGNAFSNWPSLGGAPYVREVNATFQIVGNASEDGQLTQDQSTNLQSNGTTNYGATFKLPPNATSDICFVYVTSSYQGQSAFNSTTFLIGEGPPHIVGDLGGGIPPQFFKFDGLCNGKDLALFLQCYRGTAPPNAMYLGDLGGGIPPQFFQYDGIVNGKDLALFLLCFKGQGP
jgi:hypothetical protein